MIRTTNRIVLNALIANGHNPPCDVCGYKTRKDGGCTHCERHGVSSSTDKDGHSPSEQHHISQFKASVNQDVVSFARRMLSADVETQNRSRIKICKVPNKLGEDVKRLTGIDTTGWPIVLKGNHIRHIDKRHGAQGEHDRTMSDIENFGRIGFVANHYESFRPLFNKRGERVVTHEFQDHFRRPSQVYDMRMRIDGEIAIQHAVLDTRHKSLQIISCYVDKSKKSPRGA